MVYFVNCIKISDLKTKFSEIIEFFEKKQII